MCACTRAEVRAKLRSLMVSVLVIIFFALMVISIFGEDTPESQVNICVEPASEVADSLAHNEDSYPVSTRM
jgi:hypothetical protein